MVRTKTVKASQFLLTLQPEHIYDAVELAMDYAQEVGENPPIWPIHSAKRAQMDVMRNPGQGCWVNTRVPLKPVAYGFEVAESMAREYAKAAPVAGSIQERFEHAVGVLKDKKL